MKKKSEIFFKKILTRIYFLYILCISRDAESAAAEKGKKGMKYTVSINSNAKFEKEHLF